MVKPGAEHRPGSRCSLIRPSLVTDQVEMEVAEGVACEAAMVVARGRREAAHEAAGA